jgi:hypothetical protein
MGKTTNIKLAAFISFIGHPLLTFPVFSIIVLFAYEEFQKALWHSSIIVMGIFLPLVVKMYWSTKRGTYTNFDVSNKTQRQSWYVFAIMVLAIVTGFLFVTDQPRPLCMGSLFSLILLLVSKLLNYIIKSSLHVSLNVYLSFLILPMNLMTGLFFLFFTVLIAWARLTLARHNLKEILAGAGIGFAIGIISLFGVHG